MHRSRSVASPPSRASPPTLCFGAWEHLSGTADEHHGARTVVQEINELALDAPGRSENNQLATLANRSNSPPGFMTRSAPMLANGMGKGSRPSPQRWQLSSLLTPYSRKYFKPWKRLPASRSACQAALRGISGVLRLSDGLLDRVPRCVAQMGKVGTASTTPSKPCHINAGVRAVALSPRRYQGVATRQHPQQLDPQDDDLPRMLGPATVIWYRTKLVPRRPESLSIANPAVCSVMHFVNSNAE